MLTRSLPNNRSRGKKVLRFSLSQLKGRALALATAITFGLAGAVGAQSTDPVTSDDLMWLYIQQVGSVDAYAAYLIENPEGKFADLARATMFDMAQRGILPAANVEGIEITELPEGEALASMLNGTADNDLSRFFFIEYAG